MLTFGQCNLKENGWALFIFLISKTLQDLWTDLQILKPESDRISLGYHYC